MARLSSPPPTAERVELRARCAAQGNVDISSAPAANAAVWDGLTLTVGAKVMLPRQTDQTQNRPWIWNGPGNQMTPHPKLGSGSQFYDGVEVKVARGTNDKDTTWRLLTDFPVGGYQLGTTELEWSRSAPTAGGGGSPAAVKTITNADSPYTQLATDETLVCDCTDGPITVNLLAVASANGDLWVSKSDNTSNAVTLDAYGAETIAGSGTYSAIGDQYASGIFRPHSAGSVWLVF